MKIGARSASQKLDLQDKADARELKASLYGTKYGEREYGTVTTEDTGRRNF